MKFGRMPRYSPKKPSLATIVFIREVMEGWSDAFKDAAKKYKVREAVEYLNIKDSYIDYSAHCQV